MNLDLDTTVAAVSTPLADGAAPKVLLSRALVPRPGGGYDRQDVLLEAGVIRALRPAGALAEDAAAAGAAVVDCQDKLLMPGFVNAHAHSAEHWARGLIKPLPLELWVQQLIRHEPRGVEGWAGVDSWDKTPATAIFLSAFHCGVESLLSGCTAIMDHLLVRHIGDLEAAIAAYKAVGIRAFISPMLGDDARPYENYIPLAPDADARNAAQRRPGCAGCPCGADGDPFAAMGPDGKFRTEGGAHDPQKTAAMIELWEACAKYHDPANGIHIAIGPVTAYSASPDLLRAATRIRLKYGLPGHTHLLETRAQALMAKQLLPSGSAVQHLYDCGFLQVPGTSCAHTIWLTDEEIDLMAKAGATAVHNPLSNTRLGSGVMPVRKFLEKGANVSIGCDGACSSDGQDFLEAMKMTTMLSAITTQEYRDWLEPAETALQLASKNGYQGLGLGGQAGEIAEGQIADVTLWDLTSLALLPKTDPVNLLVIGSRTAAPGAGSALHAMWVRGRQVVDGGAPCGVKLDKLREVLIEAQPEYRDPAITDPKADPETAKSEVEFRAAMGLEGRYGEIPERFARYEADRVLYETNLNCVPCRK